jgi:hypothetical protein
MNKKINFADEQIKNKPLIQALKDEEQKQKQIQNICIEYKASEVSKNE